MTSTNTALWDRVAKTDPQHTKKFQRGGGFRGTAIKPIYLFRRATEEFGPFGAGWGWTVHDTRIESGMVFALCSVWYVMKNDEGRSERFETGAQWGGTSLFDGKLDDVRAGKGRPDDESFKKSVTDAVTKCLSVMGFAADVHMGQHDDDKYVSQLAQQFDAQAAGEAPAEDLQQARLDEAYVIGAISALEKTQTGAELTKVAKSHAPRMAEIKQRSATLYERYAKAGGAARDRLQPQKPNPHTDALSAQQAAE